jgi:hypothetical protein
VARVGWGIVPVMALAIVPPFLNGAGWRLSFTPEDARSYRVTELWKLWLAMDGVNYLVPTGTVAGEVARASMLGGGLPPEVRTASVLISRFGQTVAQLTFVLVGLVFLVSGLSSMQRYGWVTTAAVGLLVVVAAGAGAYLLFAGRLIRPGDGAPAVEVAADGWLKRMPAGLRLYFGRERGRFAASVGLFAVAYAWNSVEAWWICRLIGVPVTLRSVLTIEVLSVAIDGILFFVPAKIGTQEGGKIAVFSLLGLPARFGLAFGIVRHVREVLWAVTGLLIYGARRRASAVSRSKPEIPSAPVNFREVAGVAKECTESRRRRSCH